MRRVYLDNASTTKIDSKVVSLMNSMMIENYANPSSVHEDGRKSKIIVENARKEIANLINAAPKNIFFTSGGTEADNMAIKCGIVDHNISHAITSRISHLAVLYPLQDLAKEGRIKLDYIDIDDKGVICLNHLKNLLQNNPRTFVSIMHANNEIGTIQDINEIGNICRKFNSIFHSDTVQTIGHYPFDMQNLNVDFLAASAHKFHGPKGVGFVYISDNIQINPLIRGGGQERNMRAGTENIYGIAGLAKAMELAYKSLESDKRYIKNIKKYMISKLRAEIKDIQFFGNSIDLENSLYTVLSCSLPETKNSEMLLFNLDILGISCSGGSACASGSNNGSHVLDNFSSSNNRTGIRFSFSKYTTKDEIDFTVDKLKELI